MLRVTLSPEHRAVYDSVLQRERKKVLGLIDTDLDRSRFIVFRSLTLLRMMALDPSLVDAEAYADVPSSKLEALFDRLEEVIGDGHRVLLFSQFTSYLDRVAAELDRREVRYSHLDGSTRDRDAAVTGFREGDAPVFLISLKAGGFGLTLTEADYVFLLDPWWNPAAENQAVDRAHRIGQDPSRAIQYLPTSFSYVLLGAGPPVQLSSSRRSSAVTAERNASPPSVRASNSSALRCCRASTFSSIVSSAIIRYTITWRS